MAMFTVLVLDGKHSFFENLIQHMKIISFSWNLPPRLIRICKIQWWYSFFSVLNEKHRFWANLVGNIKIVNLNWNLVPTLINNLNMQNSMVVFTFPVLDQKPFFGLIWSTNSIMSVTAFGQIWAKKGQSCQFQLKFGTKTNSNQQNSMVVFIFSVWDGKHFFVQIWSKQSQLSISE